MYCTWKQVGSEVAMDLLISGAKIKLSELAHLER
jgi:hypothetical protein